MILAELRTLFNLSLLPAWNGTADCSTNLVVLGFSTSRYVDPTDLVSYPLTYALPGPTLMFNKSLLGSLP